MSSASDCHAREGNDLLDESDSVFQSQLITTDVSDAEANSYDYIARVLDASARKIYVERTFAPYPVKAETCGLAATNVEEFAAFKICEIALFHYAQAAYDTNWLSFILGDSLNLVKFGYGEITKQAAKLGIKSQALYDFKFVCKKIPLAIRHPDLRWTAASVIARCSSQDMIEFWVRVAFEDNPSLRDLEDRIKSYGKCKFGKQGTECKKIITLAKTISSALTVQSKQVESLSLEQKKQIVAAIDKITALRRHFSVQSVDG